MSGATERTHTFNAEAKILEGDLRLPLVQKIPTQAHVLLNAAGVYRAQHSTGYRLEGVFSFRAGHSQVAGNRSTKPGQGWATLVTTVIENLNVLEVLTADRVVGQIITEHPLEGYVPSISFLGTRFENLRIAGYPVELKWDMNILGEKPANDAPYTKEPGVLSRVSSQYDSIRKHKDLPAQLAERYNRHTPREKNREVIECSLVNQAAGLYPGQSSGNVIMVPDFGIITLAKLTVTHEDFIQKTDVSKKTTVNLTMVDLKLGCAIDGEIPIGGGTSNGTTFP
ncbi:MAG: hypothetical protein ACLP7O_07910 [Terracidiphilus sp.]